MTVLYLHGFVSSPKSTKVVFFTQMLQQRGVGVRCPDFNEPDFRSMTMTRMLGRLDAELACPPATSGPAGPRGRGPRGLRGRLEGGLASLPATSGPAVLVGSSLGGALAILAASRFGSRVDRLVLLAPAVMFGDPDHHLLPREQIHLWKQRGEHEFFHYSRGGPGR